MTDVFDSIVGTANAQDKPMQPAANDPRSRYLNRKWTAKGRLPAGAMNDGEKAYAAHLEARRVAGEVLWFKFEGVKLRLADSSFYTPDFAVMLADGAIECHEIKGLWEANARTKIKVAAETFPFRFVALQKRAKKHGGGWTEEDF